MTPEERQAIVAARDARNAARQARNTAVNRLSNLMAQMRDGRALVPVRQQELREAEAAFNNTQAVLEGLRSAQLHVLAGDDATLLLNGELTES